MLDGSANAFLTLRVGMIAKRYCGAVVVQPKATLRRAATTEAAGHLGAIVSDGGARLSKAIWRASADKVGGAVSGVSGYAKDAGTKLDGAGAERAIRRAARGRLRAWCRPGIIVKLAGEHSPSRDPRPRPGSGHHDEAGRPCRSVQELL